MEELVECDGIMTTGYVGGDIDRIAVRVSGLPMDVCC